MNRIIRPTELRQILGVSASTLWRMQKSGALPRPFKLGLGARAVGWKSRVIEDWIESRSNNEEENNVDV